ncbi:MAG: D-2-hydroxyacid dehydrogenase [Clostridia bacterium]|nr:D-2-hydroxyacid dehydrogenase [Clostridia bacterium]
MLRILANDGMDASAVKHLSDCGHEVVTTFYELDVLKEKINEFDALIVRSATKVRKELIDVMAGGRCKLVIRAGVGIDNIDHVYAEEKGIAVRNTPNSSSASVAELTIGHMFAISRFIGISNYTMRNGEWNKKAYSGVELGEKTLGLIGFGRIAREVAKRAKALGMDVIYTDHLGKLEGFDEFKFVEMDELLSESDYISLHIPFIKEMGPTLGEEQFAAMKDGVRIVNAARGGVVCEKALLKALNSGKVAGAALDVFEQEPTLNEELINHPNVSATPHIGASTAEAQKRIGVETYRTVLSFFEE